MSDMKRALITDPALSSQRLKTLPILTKQVSLASTFLNLFRESVIMSSFIPVLNSDCAAMILSYLDQSSLMTIACTSKAGRAVTIPLLVHTVELYTEVPDYIISLSHLILSSRLGHYVRCLKIQHEYVHDDETDPDFLPAMQPLADLVAATNNLASLRIPVFADDLFKWAPGLVDAINAHPPSQTFEMGSISDRGWQLLRPFTGLRDLSLTFDEPTKDLDIFAVTASSAKTLISVHLGGSMHENLRIGFKQGNIPCEAARMVSFYDAETSPTDLHNAFPNVQFINSSWSNVSAGPSQYGPEILPSLIGLNGRLDTALELAPHHNICMVRLSQWINTESEFEQFAGALGAGSARSLSLLLKFDDENVDKSNRLSGQLFFSSLPRFAPQLSFADLDITLSYPGLDDISPQDTWDNTIAVCRAACVHLARLQHLKFVILNFEPSQEIDFTDLLAAFRGIATECLRSLPLADYFALNLLGETTFVTRRRDLYPGPRKTESSLKLEASEGSAQAQASAGPEGDNGDIFLIERDEGSRVMEWYRWEGSDARLEGVREWLGSVETL